MPTLMFCRRCPNFTKIFIFKNFLQEVEIIPEAEATVNAEANFVSVETSSDQFMDDSPAIVGELVAQKARRSARADGVQAYCVSVMGSSLSYSVPLDRY